MYWFETSYRPIYTIRGINRDLETNEVMMCVSLMMRCNNGETRERCRKWWRKVEKVVRKESVVVQMSFGPICAKPGVDRERYKLHSQ